MNNHVRTLLSEGSNLVHLNQECATSRGNAEQVIWQSLLGVSEDTPIEIPFQPLPWDMSSSGTYQRVKTSGIDPGKYEELCRTVQAQHRSLLEATGARLKLLPLSDTWARAYERNRGHLDVSAETIQDFFLVGNETFKVNRSSARKSSAFSNSDDDDSSFSSSDGDDDIGSDDGFDLYRSSTPNSARILHRSVQALSATSEGRGLVQRPSPKRRLIFVNKDLSKEVVQEKVQVTKEKKRY